jgi:multidrug transporter EmrE-like cation transporter
VLLMEVSAARGRFAVLGAVVLSAMMFTWVAIVNGYPLVFNDSSRYLDGAIRRYIPSESPIFYGVFMIPFHLDGVSLWPVVGAQGLILAYVIRATLRIFGFLEERTFLLVSAFLAVFTAAPWFTSLIMPDFFTPICVLVMFALFRGWEGFVPLERLFLIGLALVALTNHVTHIVIGLALATLFAALRLSGRPSHRTALLVVLALPLVAFGAVVGINLIAKGRPVITRDGPVFLLARSFADGPAYEYMRDHCGERKWHLCAAYRTLPRDAQDFLWSPAGSVWSVGSHDEVRTEASDIVYGAIKEHPGETLLAALGNGFAQLVTYRAGVDFDGFLSVAQLPVFHAAISLYAVSTVLWVWLLSRVTLMQAYPWVSAGVVIVPLLSGMIFGERVNAAYWLGAALIVAGIAITQYSVQS